MVRTSLFMRLLPKIISIHGETTDATPPTILAVESPPFLAGTPSPSTHHYGASMFTLLRHAGLRRSLWAEAPCLGVSMITAEAFYKFHSFTLECLAFLATW